MAARTTIPDIIPEKSTARYAGVLRDETGATIAAAALTTLTLTIYDELSGSIVNGVNGTNILNVGRGTVDVSGNLVILFDPLDNQIIDDARRSETHIWLIQFTYAAGAKAGRHEVAVTVANFVKVT